MITGNYTGQVLACEAAPAATVGKFGLIWENNG